jgi:hypothetical protein
MRKISRIFLMLFLAAVLFSCRQSVEIGKDTAEFLGEGAYAGE